MAKVYSPPKGLNVPKFNSDWKVYETAEAKFVTDVSDWCKKHGSGEYAGEEVYFPYADGHARYIVLSTRPLRLVHLPVGDAWNYPYIERLSARDIIARIETERGITRLFQNPVEIAVVTGPSK